MGYLVRLLPKEENIKIIMLLMMGESTGIEIIWKNNHLSGGFQRKDYLFF